MNNDLDKDIYKLIFKALYIYNQLLEGWIIEKLDNDDTFKFVKNIDSKSIELDNDTINKNIKISMK
tara:strand:+ start:1086 stop:1283 length:198 start_codon:yes stop_codon:yes gene_type:complete